MLHVFLREGHIYSWEPSNTSLIKNLNGKSIMFLSNTNKSEDQF